MSVRPLVLFLLAAGLASAQEELPAEIRQALDSPSGAGEIPLRMAAYVLGPGAEGRSRVVVVAEADPRALTAQAGEGQERITLNTYFRVGPASETEAVPLDMGVPPEARARLDVAWVSLTRVRELPAGAYEARMAVRDRVSGRVGWATQRFEVPDASQFRISSPVLTDVLAPDGSTPVLTARRAFAPGSRISLQFEVQGAAPDPATGKPRVRVGYELHRAGGAVASRAEPTGIAPGSDGRVSLSLAFSPRLPGPAEFVITAEDEVSGRTAERREAFTVDAAASPLPALASSAPAAVPAVGHDASGLRQLVRLYRQGSVEAAVGEWARWTAAERVEALRGLRHEATSDPGAVAAAALLTIEAAFGVAPGQEKGELDEVRRLIEAIAEPGRREEMLVLWLAAVGQRYEHLTRFDQAETYLEECLKRSPSDPHANLALGSLRELRASLSVAFRDPLAAVTNVPAGSESVAKLREKARQASDAGFAEKAYRKVLADPVLGPEARLRLGRALLLLDKKREAVAELETASGAQDPRLRAMAFLFLARAESDDPAASLRRARAAQEALPGSRVVATALAYALGRVGEPAEGAAVMRAALSRSAAGMDAWMAYQIGAFNTGARDVLRQRVSR